MGRASKISRMPAAIRDRIAAWHAAGHSIDEIMASCLAEFPDVPPEAWPARSRFGVHMQGLDKLGVTIQRSRIIAEVLVQRLGDAPESRQARLNIELLHSVVTNLMLEAVKGGKDGQPVSLPPDQVQALAKSLDHLARAQRTDMEATLHLRKELALKQNSRITKAAADVATIAKASGLSAERIAELQAKVAGLRVEPGVTP
jgi:hypothetical protein